MTEYCQCLEVYMLSNGKCDFCKLNINTPYAKQLSYAYNSKICEEAYQTVRKTKNEIG